MKAGEQTHGPHLLHRLSDALIEQAHALARRRERAHGIAG